jgi:hypothetical protein
VLSVMKVRGTGAATGTMRSSRIDSISLDATTSHRDSSDDAIRSRHLGCDGEQMGAERA